MSFLKLFLCIVVNLAICAIIVNCEENLATIAGDCTEIRVLNGSDSGNGYLAVPLNTTCDIYTFHIQCLNKSSIISIKPTPNDMPDEDDKQNRGIQVEFKETSKDENQQSKLLSVVLMQWNIASRKDRNKIYFSRTTDLQLSIKVNGNWSENDLKFDYEEIEFKEYKRTSSNEERKIVPWVPMKGRGYRPNSVSVFYITKSDDKIVNSIHLFVHKLEIDEGIGEYLLIGAGKELFQGSPPLFISNIQQKKEIKINDENAYIIFVAASTRSNYSGFEITWEYNATKISDKEDNIIDPKKEEAMPICIVNASAAFNEFNRSNPFSEFKEKLAKIGTEYARNKSKTFSVHPNQVQIYRVSAVIKNGTSEDLQEATLYVMVKIQGSKEGTSAFDWIQLGEILQHYSTRFQSEVINGYQIRTCPEREHRKWWANVKYYAIILALLCLFLLVWNWKSTPFHTVLSKNIKQLMDKRKKDLMIPAGDKEYVPNDNANTDPKIVITNTAGRRCTYNSIDVPSSGGEQESDNEVFNRRDLKRGYRRPSIKPEPKSARSSTRSQKIPQINEAYVKDEDLSKTSPKSAQSSIHETENFYTPLEVEKKQDDADETDEAETAL
ncbi:uncharacterized protein CDAR_447411 [Caerostris darwini]|uniref:Uncharacterized protein n=1 Tax=Caerostris darwini TaxID=1538125 RepID=A0AAV4PSW0_9ARAC|nr:uncharacterized protein CDAR_447411 [Caerostris darwini]